MKRLILLSALAALAACATPVEQCIDRASRDLEVVNDLIAETKATIERGYALDYRNVPETRFRFCYTDEGRAYFCTDRRTRVETRPVAVDLAEEARKLASLEDKRRELVLRTEREVAACRAAYPTQTPS